MSDPVNNPLLSVEGLSTFKIPPRYIAGLDDILAGEDDSVCDNNTITFSNVFQSQPTTVPKVVTNGYGDVVTQVNTGAKVTVTNLPWVLHNIIWYKESNKRCPVAMYGATSTTLIRPEAEGKLAIPADNVQGFIFIHVKAYYSPIFNSILLSDKDVLLSTLNPKEYSVQTLDLLITHNLSSVRMQKSHEMSNIFCNTSKLSSFFWYFLKGKMDRQLYNTLVPRKKMLA